MVNETGQLFGGSWTEQKLQILKDYLASYNTALKNQPFTRVYVDAFAGTGYRQQRKIEYGFDLFEEVQQEESESFLKGSAKLALEATPPFHRYIFIESNEKKVAELEKLRSEHPHQAGQIQIFQGDANQFVQDYCIRENWREVRAVLFLDPFATEVVWKTIEAVARTKAIDLWILFPLMAVNRLLARDPVKAWHDRLNLIFGTDEWFEQFYRTRRLDDIFGKPEDVVDKACDFSRIGSFFQSRLRSIFAGVAESSRVFKNYRGTPLFQLFFAAANERGARVAVKIAEHLLKRM